MATSQENTMRGFTRSIRAVEMAQCKCLRFYDNDSCYVVLPGYNFSESRDYRH